MKTLRVPKGALIALTALLISGAPTASAHDSPAAPVEPVERPARGLIYRGLTPAPEGSACEGGFRVDTKGPVVCTHGPDPAPAGIDVREPRSITSLRAATFGAGAQAAAADASALVPCIGDGSSGNRVQVIYARPADRPNRFAELRSLIGTWASQASSVFADSAAQTGGSRAIRFVTLPSPNCELVIANVTLSSAADDDFGNTIDELHAAGYNRSDRKYMVFMDANQLCGIGEIRSDDQPGKGNANNGIPGVPGSIGRTDTGCWGQLGVRNSVEAHELVHNLGGVQLSAPNSSGGWHCVDEYDTECYSDEPYFPPMKLICPSSEEVLLDCNDNDYFNTNPPPGSYLDTHWNVANSVFLTAEGPTAPANDAFSAAQTLSGTEAVRLGDNSEGATKEPGEPNHAGNPGGASIWYSWTAPTSGQAVVDTAGSSYDTLLAVYSGSSIGSLVEIGSNDDVAPGSDSSSRVGFEAVAGQTYKIAIDGYGGASGTARLQLAGHSPPPTNDAFDAAQTLSGSDVSREADTNRKATKEPGEPNHAGNSGGASIWYSWTAPASGPVVVETAGSDFDTLLAVYSGSAVSSLTGVAANDDADPSVDLTSKVTFTASAGQTYRIAVDGFKSEDNPAVGTVRLRLQGTELAPPNDAFASAQLLSGSEVFREGDTNRKATKEPGEPAHAGNSGGASIWYRWTAPASGPVLVETAGSDFDTLLAAYVGSSVGSLTEVAANDDVSGLRTSRLSFDADAGVTYRIAVDGYTGSEDVATGAVNLFLTQIETGPANDAFAGAIPLAGSTASRDGDSNTGATKEPGEPNHAGNPGGASIWYRWTAPSSGPVTVRTAGSDFDTLLAVYTGGGVASLSPVAADDDMGPGLTSSVDFVATAGQTFRIAVDGFNGSGGAARGHVAIGVLPGDDSDGQGGPTPPPKPTPPPGPRVFPPQTRILAGPRSQIYSRRATFRFGANQPARFSCQLDSRRWSACKSPKRFRGLTPGGHVFRVRAIGLTGLIDGSPATRRFRVVW